MLPALKAKKMHHRSFVPDLQGVPRNSQSNACMASAAVSSHLATTVSNGVDQLKLAMLTLFYRIKALSMRPAATGPVTGNRA